MSTRKLYAMLFAAIAGVAFLLANVPQQPALPALERSIPSNNSPEPPYATGWIDDPEAVEEAAALMQCGRFRDTVAFSACDDQPKEVFLWEACRAVTDDVLPARDQKSVGCCVSFATASAIEHLLCVQIEAGACEEYRDLAQEVIYGGSRVEIGGGRIRGDGSVGAWAARFVSEYGVIPRGIHGKHDLQLYDEARCREFGRLGVPDDLEKLAKEHPVKSVTRVLSWDECRAAIRNGYPVMVCSSQGFGMQRDQDGFCSPRGVWYHAMAVIGVRGDPRPGGFLLNSWGATAHTGPRYPPDAPAAGFWVDADVLDRMLRQGDSWSFSRAAGFPPSVVNGSGSKNPPHPPSVATLRRRPFPPSMGARRGWLIPSKCSREGQPPHLAPILGGEVVALQRKAAGEGDFLLLSTQRARPARPKKQGSGRLGGNLGFSSSN